MSIRSFHYGTTTIEYHLAFAQRKTLSITIQPDCSVKVVAPVGSPLEIIEAKLKGHSAWIVKRQTEFARYLPLLPPRQYVSGETHLYLGKQYRLKVIGIGDTTTVQEAASFLDGDLSATRPGVKLSRGRFYIYTAEPTDPVVVKAQLEAWYRQKAQSIFAQQLVGSLKRVAGVGITATPELRIRTLQKRWGSCTTTGVITLNLKLIQAPKHLIDYVITHELCHLKEHNHSPAYYRLLERVMPDWRDRREALNQLKVA